MKAFTSIEQSKKLAEILPLESADFFWLIGRLHTDGPRYQVIRTRNEVSEPETCWPCWSLASLLDVLPYPQLSKDKLGSGKEGWMVSVYPDNCRYESCWHDNPIDACYELILKLNEQKISDYGSTTL